MKAVVMMVSFVTTVLFGKAQQVKLGNSNLWMISGNKLTKPSYILLTATNCDQALILSNKLQACLKNVNAIIVEFDLYGSKDADKLGANNLATTDSQKLKPNLSNAAYLQYTSIFKKNGYPDEIIKEFMNYKLGMLYALLKMTAEPCGTDHEPMAYELQLKPVAKKEKLLFDVLQNIDQVIHETNAHTNAYWQQNISYHLNEEQTVKELLSTEADLYHNEKIMELQKLYTTNKYYTLQNSDAVMQQHPIFLEAKIEQLLTTPSLFSIDISNILFPANSVFEILAAKGYTMTPVLQ